MSKKKIHLGTITALEQVKSSQEWQGNQRGIVHKNKKIYNRKEKYKKNYKDYYR